MLQAAEEDRRPITLLYVYSWDVVRALFALLAAVASFGGAVMVGSRQVEIPLWQQLLYATSAASYGAALFVIGVLLPRRAAWVRRAQITVFSLSAGLALVSLLLQVVTDVRALEAAAVILNLVFVALYALGIVAMTLRSAVDYFRGPGATPRYLIVLVGYWCCVQAALTVLHLGS